MARVWRDKDIYKLMLHYEFGNQPVEVTLYDGTTAVGYDIGFFSISEVAGTSGTIGGENLPEIKARASLRGRSLGNDMQIAVAGASGRKINRLVVRGTSFNPGDVEIKVDLTFAEVGLTPITVPYNSIATINTFTITVGEGDI